MLVQAGVLFKNLCNKLDALSHFHFAPKPVRLNTRTIIRLSVLLYCIIFCTSLKWGGCSSLIKSSNLLYVLLSHFLTLFMLHIGSILRLTALEIEKRPLVFWLYTMQVLLGLLIFSVMAKVMITVYVFLCPDNWGSGCQGGCPSTGNGRGMVFHFLFSYPLVVPLNLWWLMLQLLLVSSWV